MIWGDKMKVLWAHGFESTPNGSKPIWIKENLGWEVISINMSEKGWTIAEQTEVVIQKILENDDLELIMGSSYGGLAIANASNKLLNRKLRLVLMAPAFGLAEKFRKESRRQGIGTMGKDGVQPLFPSWT